MSDFNYDPQNNNESAFDQTVFQSMPMQTKSRTRGYAVASLVLGICTFVCSCICCCCYYLSLPLGIIAIIMTFLDRRENDGKMSGMALTGLIFAIFGLVGFAACVSVEFYMANLSNGELIKVLENFTGKSYEEIVAEYNSSAVVLWK